MAVAVLPSTPAPARMSIGIVSAANELTSATGASDQEIQRKGDRHALTFTMPLMTFVTSMTWGDLTIKGQIVLMRVHQPGFDTAAPGSPLVDGASQAGNSLVVDGLTANYIVRKDQFLSVITAGQRFLYRARDYVVADADGKATIPLKQMLRVSPANNDVVEIAQPMIEGFARDVQEFEVGVDRLVALKFTVRERE